MGTELEPHQELANDGGLASRKLWLTIGVIIAIIGVSILSAFMPVLIPELPTIVGGILGALGLYLGGNVAVKFAAGKVAQRSYDGYEPEDFDNNPDKPVERG